jgi:aspartyl-tRNA(Asn)/glutamyl-tRNA(Gln) amidotransferase subunit B
MNGSELEAVIGLEVHVQLATRTKMFCSCPLSFGDPPNVHTCPVCLALPGALPVLNEQAVHYGVMVGVALGCDIAERSIFARKQYFYPDNPKAYQISQYETPLCTGGRLGEVRIHRVHLEEDAAKLVHIGHSGRIHGADASIVDFNRGGTPLIEIVTEPDLRSAAQAGEWLRLMRSTLRQLGVSDVNMEEGSLRADANVSVRPAGSYALGTKTELKNMNSFRFLERGIDAELRRQRELMASGAAVEQETLHFDPQTGTLTPLRTKEEAQDYRYFPEPDLPPLEVTPAMIKRARAELPELPADRQRRYQEELGLSAETARLLAFREGLGAWFERALATGEAEPQPLANWTTQELAAVLAGCEPAESKVQPEALAALVGMVARKEVSASAGKTVLEKLAADGGEPAPIVEAEGLGAMGDGDELDGLVQAAIDANPDAAEKIRAGKQQAVGAIIGHVMRETKGRADGGEVSRIVREKLGV